MVCFSDMGFAGDGTGDGGTLARDPGRATKLQALRLAIAVLLYGVLVVAAGLSRELSVAA